MKQTACGRDFLSGRALSQLAKELSTPFLLYDEAGLRAAARQLLAAFSRCSGYGAYFPVRLCPRAAVLRLLREEGCGAACASYPELLLAARCGFAGERLVYMPLAREEAGERLALESGAVWLLDGPQVLPARPPGRALVALRPEGKTGPDGKFFASFGRGKFGADLPVAALLVRQLADLGVGSVGAALTAQANELDPDYYPAAAELLFTSCARLQEKTGVPLGACCLGDGLGVSFRPEFPEPDAARCAARIAELAQRILVPAGLGGAALRMVLGRRLCAHSGLYVMRVTAVKPRQRPLVLTDGSCAMQRGSFLFSGGRRLSAPGKRAGKELLACDAAGASPDERDRFADGCLLPPLRAGDLLALHDVGADGGFCTAAGPACAEYLLRTDGTVRLLRPAGTAEAYAADGL